MRLVAAVLLALAACTSTVLDAADYDRSCAQDADCVAVATGDQCRPCLCPDAAIRTSAKAAFDADVAAAKDACGPIPAVSCAPCPSSSAACRSGACGLTGP